MVYITGDIHGDVQYIRDAIAKFNITEDDMIVILGDVGMNYYGRHGDRQRKKKMNKLGVPILCIHGNHEMRPFTIPSYYETTWQGGVVYEESEFRNYEHQTEIERNQILDFHVRFEEIFPFEDGNGRVGRLIMFKECLRHGTMPFIIDDKRRSRYLRGIKEWHDDRFEMIDVVMEAQGRFEAQIEL